MATINAASCSSTDVQTAITAASSGDTVLIPAGSATWTTPGASTPAVTIAKSIVLKGAGVANTHITVACDGTWLEWPVWVHDIASLDVSGIDFDGTSNYFGIFYCSDVASFRFHDNRFDGLSGTSIVLKSGCYGVIDNNYFTTPGVRCILIDGGPNWNLAMPWSSANTVFIEDNIFDLANVDMAAVDAGDRGCYVFRYNTVYKAGIENHGMDSSPPAIRGCRLIEAYNNTFIADGAGTWAGITFRGGTGVVWDNTFSGTWDRKFHLCHYRAESLAVSPGLYDSDWPRCEGTCPIDGNESGEMGYPGRDQVGRSQDSFAWSASLPFTGPYPTQDLDPIYQWGNGITDAVINDQGSTSPAQSDHIQANRDYYNNVAKPGYSPYTYPHPLRGTSIYMRMY